MSQARIHDMKLKDVLRNVHADDGKLQGRFHEGLQALSVPAWHEELAKAA
jgi:hypothetical protein